MSTTEQELDEPSFPNSAVTRQRFFLQSRKPWKLALAAIPVILATWCAVGLGWVVLYLDSDLSPSGMANTPQLFAILTAIATPGLLFGTYLCISATSSAVNTLKLSETDTSRVGAYAGLIISGIVWICILWSIASVLLPPSPQY